MNESDLNTTSPLTNSSTLWLVVLSLVPFRIVCPILFIFCPIANFVCINIFLSPLYNRSSSKWYFIGIAIFDTIYVTVTAPFMFLLSFQIYIVNWNILLCKSILFLNYLSCQISAGLLACLSIDRLIATSCSMIYRRRCSTNLSKNVCLVIIAIFSIVNLHYLIGYSIDSQGRCTNQYYQWYANYYSYLNIVYLLSYSIVPFTVITVCNFFIVQSVYRTKSTIRRKYLKKKKRPTPSKDLVTNGRTTQSVHQMVTETEIEKTLTRLSSSIVVVLNDNRNQLLPVGLSDDDPIQQTNGNVEPSIFEIDERFILTDQKQIRDSSKSEKPRRSRYSQRIGIQLQITVSLIAISISFIFCTLPNCISTIMIQHYNRDEQRRELWQALNFFSIVPLLITHSVNIVFYYLSSNMFRDCFRENYLSKRTTS